MQPARGERPPRRLAEAREGAGRGEQEGEEDEPGRERAAERLQDRVQAKFFAAKSQFARLARKVSTNFGRALR